MKKDHSSISAAALRRKVREKLKERTEHLRDLSAKDLKQLVTELGTHEIELEMQNEELRNAQTELEASRNTYAELYNFAPIGYFTLDARGIIRDVNRTGA